MFELTLTQALYDALDEAKKPFYKLNETTKDWDLQVNGVPDVTGLKAKVTQLLDEKKESDRKAREALETAARASGDTAALENSWKTRLETETGALKSDLQKKDSMLARLTVGRAATEIAAELAVVTNGVSSSKALLPHIERRLTMEQAGDEVIVRVLDTTGKPSAMTVDQLKDEFRNDPVFAPLIAAGKANGGGADGDKSKGGGGAAKKYSEHTESELKQLYKTNKPEFDRLKAAGG